MRRVALWVALAVVAAGAVAVGVTTLREDTPSGAYGTASGEASRAPDLINTYGCAACHDIPGVRGPGGRVGPPLHDFGDRRYIAGALTNTPENLVEWLLSPQSIEPGTAMPDLGLTEQAAQDIAAYLSSL